MRILAILLLAACGTKAPPPKAPDPVVEEDEQRQCQRIAERTVERFVTAAIGQWEYPELPKPTLEQALRGDGRTMFTTVVFDSCFAEWPKPARACFLSAAADASIESCRTLDAELRAKAIRRTATVLYSLSS